MTQTIALPAFNSNEFARLKQITAYRSGAALANHIRDAHGGKFCFRRANSLELNAGSAIVCVIVAQPALHLSFLPGCTCVLTPQPLRGTLPVFSCAISSCRRRRLWFRSRQAALAQA